MFLEHKRNLLKNFLAKVLVAVMILSSLLVSVPSVAEAETKPAISKKSRTILAGDKYNLNIKNKVKGSTYKWKSSNKKIATVDKRGVVKGKKKGKVTITCTIKTPKKTYKVSSNVTIRKPANRFEINNKVSALNLGQKYNLNRTLYPMDSNDLTSWASSDETIASPNARGKFTTLKEGTVTITGTTLSGKTDQVTIKVVDEAGTVTTQEELNELLGSGAGLITIKTDEEIGFTIPKGDYSNQRLVVDAPKGEVTNHGVFKSIEILNIKPNTWYEQAIGNEFNVTASNARIIVDTNAEASIISNGTNLNIVNNGTIRNLTLNSDAEVNIQGRSTTPIPVIANVTNAKITTNIPVAITCNQRVTLNILPGAETSTVTVPSEEFIPIVTGSGSINVVIGSGENAVTRTISGTGSNSSGGSGSSHTPSPDPTPTPDPDPVITTGKISGKVTAVSDRVTEVSGGAIVVTGSAINVSGDAITVIPNAYVYLLKYEGTTANAAIESIFTNPNTIITVTDENGLYSVDELEAGNYVVVMAKEGYKVLIQLTSVAEGGSTVLNGSLIPLNEGETTANGYATGKIIDALDGQQVDANLGFTFKVYSRNDGDSGALVHTQIVTGAAFSLELPEGYYTVEVTDNREATNGVTYAKALTNLVILGGSTFDNQDIVLSTLKTDGQATFVLTWDEFPYDLDSHLIGPAGTAEKYHICYYNKHYPLDVDHDDFDNLHLRLDLDDVTSYGPETTTIYRPVEGGVYTFYVHNYSGNYHGTLATSGAKVVVTTSTESMTFEVPNGGEERSWIVCSFDSATGRITPINEFYEGNYKDTIEDLDEWYY